jgi:GT2 family glycosyltransferase
MKVYAIIVNYNGANWILRCLDSLINSSVIINIIVVDNFSQDNSVSIIKEAFDNIVLIQLNKNLGFGQANNLGIKKAYSDGADFVFLLNQDAWVESNTVELLINSLKNEYQYGLVSPIHFNGKGDSLDLNFSNYICPSVCPDLYSDMWTNNLTDRLYEVKFVNAAAWLLNRKTVEIIGGFNPVFFHYGEDVNYIDRLHFHGLKVGVLAHSKIFHSRENRIQQKFLNQKFDLELREVIIKYSNPNQTESMFKFFKRLMLNIVKKIFKLKFKEAFILLKKLKALFKKASEIEKSRKLSQEIGLTYL